jgi:hypothetical protein
MVWLWSDILSDIVYVCLMSYALVDLSNLYYFVGVLNPITFDLLPLGVRVKLVHE